MTGYSYEWVNPADSNDVGEVSVSVTHDANGNVIRIETGTDVEEYEYDWLGRETFVTVNGRTT